MPGGTLPVMEVFMNYNLPVPIEEGSAPYLQKRRRKQTKAWSRYLLILLAVCMLTAFVICAGKFGLFSFFAGGIVNGETDTSEETTTGETTTDLYDFDYEKLSEDALAILPCDLSAWTLGMLYENHTDYTIDTIMPEELERVSGDRVTVLVINTHPYEAYSASGAYEYRDGSYVNSSDANNTVVAVADAFIDALSAKGIKAIYVELSTTSGLNSYTAAYEALEEAMERYPDVQYVVDIHRALMLDEDGNMLRPVTSGELGVMAQMRLVAGTDADGALYDDWQDGVAASLALAEKMTASYPSLMMPTEISGSRLNQHLPVTVFTAEIGTCGNSLEEALRTASAFGEVFAAAITK